MKVLLQRVSHAQVRIDDKIVGQIQRGLLLLIGIEKHDNAETLQRMANKVLAYRVFADDQGKMNLSVKDIGGGVLAVSQFTLAANTTKGLRPGFSDAATPEDACHLYQNLINMLKQQHQTVEQGVFAADMQVSLTNDGPVTFLLST